VNALQVVVQGTLRPDGTLELAEAPTLPPGPVEVLIRSQPALDGGADTWWEFLQRSRAELLDQGMSFRSKEQVQADCSRQRSQDELRRQELNRQQAPGE
jgi:hypothetical protein